MFDEYYICVSLKKLLWGYTGKLLFFLALAACGTEPDKDRVTDTGSPSNENNPQADGTQEDNADDFSFMVSIPIKINNELNIIVSDNSLSLTGNASAYSITVDSCISGLSATINQSSASVNVYKYDRDCLAKLTTFAYDGATYTPSSSDPFTTWQAGDEAVFENTIDSNDLMFVSLVSTLSSPVIGFETISYSFSSTLEGTSSSGILQATLGAGSDLIDGAQSAPPFSIYEMRFTGITSQNEGEFEFTFECDVSIVGTDCNGVDLSNITYILVEDTYSSAPSHANAESAFSGGSTSIDTSSEKLATGEGGTTNGGFVTKSGASVLVGPQTLTTKPNMIVFLKAAGVTNSYRYFNVDINLSVDH
ncbi:MAG: hypothetical protein AB8G05_22640 [Oligoflexales bacterium]